MNNNSIHSLCIINRIVYRSSTQGFPPEIFCFCIIGRGHKMATNYEGAVTIEFATLRTCMLELTSEISADPLSVAERLLAKGLIPESLYNSVQNQTKENKLKASELVDRVTQNIKIFPENFNAFMDVLTDCNWLQWLTKLLRERYAELLTQKVVIS